MSMSLIFRLETQYDLGALGLLREEQEMITQMMPADGWYFRHIQPSGHVAIYRLAAWGLHEDGEVVGLVNKDGVSHGATLHPIDHSNQGSYLHESSLTADALRVYLKSGIVC